MSWEPEDVGGCKLSPTKIKDTLEERENEIQVSLMVTISALVVF